MVINQTRRTGRSQSGPVDDLENLRRRQFNQTRRMGRSQSGPVDDLGNLRRRQLIRHPTLLLEKPEIAHEAGMGGRAIYILLLEQNVSSKIASKINVGPVAVSIITHRHRWS